MTGRRSSHVSKSQGDREDYFRNTVYPRNPSPTLEDPFTDADSTITAAPPNEAPLPKYESTRPRSPSPLGQYLREKWPEILVGVIVAFLLWQIFSLNREVGELNIQLKEIQTQGTRLESQIDKLGDRFDRMKEKQQETPVLTPTPLAQPDGSPKH